jgi:hypothetical protein
VVVAEEAGVVAAPAAAVGAAAEVSVAVEVEDSSHATGNQTPRKVLIK